MDVVNFLLLLPPPAATGTSSRLEAVCCNLTLMQGSAYWSGSDPPLSRLCNGMDFESSTNKIGLDPNLIHIYAHIVNVAMQSGSECPESA